MPRLKRVTMWGNVNSLNREFIMESRKQWKVPQLRELDIAGETRLGLLVGSDMIIIGTAS
jgi:hypothetical protein